MIFYSRGCRFPTCASGMNTTIQHAFWHTICHLSYPQHQAGRLQPPPRARYASPASHTCVMYACGTVSYSSAPSPMSAPHPPAPPPPCSSCQDTKVGKVFSLAVTGLKQTSKTRDRASAASARTSLAGAGSTSPWQMQMPAVHFVDLVVANGKQAAGTKKQGTCRKSTNSTNRYTVGNRKVGERVGGWTHGIQPSVLSLESFPYRTVNKRNGTAGYVTGRTERPILYRKISPPSMFMLCARC